MMDGKKEFIQAKTEVIRFDKNDIATTVISSAYIGFDEPIQGDPGLDD